MLTLTFFDANFASDTLDTTANILTAFNPYLTLVLGVLLGIVVIVLVLNVLIHR